MYWSLIPANLLLVWEQLRATCTTRLFLLLDNYIHQKLYFRFNWWKFYYTENVINKIWTNESFSLGWKGFSEVSVVFCSWDFSEKVFHEQILNKSAVELNGIFLNFFWICMKIYFIVLYYLHVLLTINRQ